MTLSRLCAECAACRFKETCQHKRMEMVGFVEPVSAQNVAPLEANLAVPHEYRQVKIAPGTTVTIDLKDIEKDIAKSIAESAGLYGGFLKSCT